MAIVPDQQIEEAEARIGELQSEVDSYADEVVGKDITIAERDMTIAALLAEVRRLRARLG